MKGHLWAHELGLKDFGQHAEKSNNPPAEPEAFAVAGPSKGPDRNRSKTGPARRTLLIGPVAP
ncbi:MAG: hypothetical protein ACLQU1_19055, partial [Bryobacteraceae bacterium]